MERIPTWNYLCLLSYYMNYDTNTLVNDIALLKLRTSLTYNDYVRPICLPSSTYDFETSLECHVAGWGGIVNTAQEYPIYLQEAKFGLINDTVCAADSNIAPIPFYPNLMQCAGYIDGYVTICNGDSGGPLMCRGQDNVWRQAGVVSWGPVNGSISCMGISVFAEVKTYITWIKSKTGIS